MQTAPIEGVHASINHKIDETYITTIEQAAQLLDYLDNPKGSIDGVYKRFKNPFYQLFLLTHNIKEMRANSKTSEDISAWLKSSISKESAHKGLDLFVEYQRCLFDTLIITRRDGR